MWIAKPPGALSEAERAAWIRVPGKPLAQTLAWAHAAESLRPGAVQVVFSPDEGVGGIVIAASREGELECINGPLLHWQDSAQAPRQLATFAVAAAKANASRFHSLALRPRWYAGDHASHMTGLPVQAHTWHQAQTLELDLQNEFLPGPRLGRTLRRAAKAGTLTESREFVDAAGFHARMDAFSRRKGFTVPPATWFSALRKHAAPELRLFEVLAHNKTLGAEAGLLLALHGTHAHYLFGWEERGLQVPAWLSVSAPAQLAAIRLVREQSATVYDFNGFSSDLAPEDAYAGVVAFKAQFGGRIVSYEVPEFVIA